MEISAAAFHFNLQQKENTFFTTSIHEIDQELEARSLDAEDNPANQAEVRQKLPRAYQAFQDVFSEAASNQLPPQRSYDHRIELETGLTLTHGPLYSQTTAELQAMKKYLEENLDKGFIAPSQAPFSSPVLFIKKPNRQLRFCIDFRKLNLIIRKDRYLLPLINETLARLNKAKVFTKLDICQVFY